MRKDSAEFEQKIEAVQTASDLFDKLCRERHEEGASNYGDLAFLENDTLAMAMEELVDFANYARYTFIKIVLLSKRFEGIDIGAEAFTPAIPKEE